MIPSLSLNLTYILESLYSERIDSGTACVLSVPIEDFRSLGNSVKEPFRRTFPGVNWKLICKYIPSWLSRKLQRCCRPGEAEAGGLVVVATVKKDMVGTDPRRRSCMSVLHILRTVGIFLPYVINGHIFFFYEIYAKD